MLAKGTDGQAPVGRPAPEFTRKRIGELTLPERTAWSRLRSQNPALYSPYFDIAYSDMVASLRPDTYVIMASRAGEPVAFFPYQGAGKFAAPIGAPMTDYHGVIKAPSEPIDIATLLHAAGLGGFNFNALIETRNIEAQNHTPITVRSQHQAAVMDVAQGAKAWREARDGSYRRSLKSLRRRIRKTESEHGAPRFVFNSRDQGVFDTLMGWKRAQFKTTGKYDVLSAGWTLDLLTRLWHAPETELHCVMHALYFGDTLAAVDFGMTDGPVYHSWIVAYDNQFSTLSPGIQLLEGLIDGAQELGYQRIDLGAGTDGYKKNYAAAMSDPNSISTLEVKSGFVAVQGAAGKMLSLYGKAEVMGEKHLADMPGKLRRRYTQIANCEPRPSARAKAMAAAVFNRGK